MKNILILEQIGSETTYGFIKDVNNITDSLMKKSVIAALNSNEQSNYTNLSENNEEISVRNNEILSSRGFYFSNEFFKKPPFEIEHIIEHISR